MNKIEKKLCWRVTRRCNLRCLHCLSGFKNRFIPELDRVSHLEILSAISDAGITRISWTGGEPTMLPWLNELLHVSRSNGINNLITTNAQSLSKKLLKNLCAEHDVIRISFDGMEETHNYIRGGNFFSKSLASIDKIRELGVDVEANITLTSLNQNELPFLVSKLVEKGVSKVVLLDLLNRESAISNCVEPADEQIHLSINKMVKEYNSHPRNIEIQYNNYTTKNDRYIVLESDGSLMLSTEDGVDQFLGYAHKSGAKQALLSALRHQNLLHSNLVSAIS